MMVYRSTLTFHFSKDRINGTYNGKMLTQSGFFFFFFFFFFYDAFNNISVISWRSVLLVEETGVPGENHHHIAIH